MISKNIVFLSLEFDFVYAKSCKDKIVSYQTADRFQKSCKDNTCIVFDQTAPDQGLIVCLIEQTLY